MLSNGSASSASANSLPALMRPFISQFYDFKVGHGRLMWIQFHKAMAFFVSISYITAITFLHIFREYEG